MDLLSIFCLFVALRAERKNVVAAFNPFEDRYLGCFEISWAMYDTPMGTGTVLNRLTLEACRWHCEQQMSTFFAVRSIDDCYCGNRFSRHRHLSDRSCFMRCAGDYGQICGGPLALRIHYVCPKGFYGPRCAISCSNCGIHEELGSGCYFNGTCTGGCQDGWDGPKCDTNLGPVLVVRPPAKNTYTSHDGSFVWNCMVANIAANISYSIKWYTPNGIEISVAGNRVYIRTDGLSSVKLHVLQQYELANERYTCSANISGFLQQKYVTVYVQPFITKDMLTKSVTEGTNLTLSCEAQGLPKPQFRFYKSYTTNSPLESGNRIVVDDRAGLLKFQPAQREDEGYYFCKAFNNVGDDTKEGRIAIWSKPTGCALNNGGCSHYCTDHASTVKCHCKSGHELHSDGKTCQVETRKTSGRTIAIIISIIASVVLLGLAGAAYKYCQNKDPETSQPAAPRTDTTLRDRADETAAFSHHRDDQPTSVDAERTREREVPAINPDFGGTEPPGEAQPMITSAPDVEPPSYDELYGDVTREKVDED